jgi:hypothetical protein
MPLANQPASLVSQVNYEKLREIPRVSRYSPPLMPSEHSRRRPMTV